jgi:hypothetical protein
MLHAAPTEEDPSRSSKRRRVEASAPASTLATRRSPPPPPLLIREISPLGFGPLVAASERIAEMQRRRFFRLLRPGTPPPACAKCGRPALQLSGQTPVCGACHNC